jgi:hypothetical protein
MLGNNHQQGDLAFDRLSGGVEHTGRRYHHHGGIHAVFAGSFGNGVIDGYAQDRLATFARPDAGNHLHAVIKHFGHMVAPMATGGALYDHTGGFINEDRHGANLLFSAFHA